MVSANVDRVAEKEAKLSIGDALKKQGFPSGLLSDQHFIRESTALVNEAKHGIAYLNMTGIRQHDIRKTFGGLAEYVAKQMGLPEPQAHERGDKVA